jgi:hypothetical protein
MPWQHSGKVTAEPTATSWGSPYLGFDGKIDGTLHSAVFWTKGQAALMKMGAGAVLIPAINEFGKSLTSQR